MRGIEQIPWVYDAICALSDWRGLRRWREWLARGSTGRTLELGCGTGRNLRFFRDQTRTVGLDPSPEALRRARKRAPRTPLVIGSAQALPFRDGAFDTVVSSLVFCSVPDPPSALQEVGRVLRPDGRLRMVEHVRARSRFGARLQDLYQPLWTRVTGGCHPNRDTEAAVRAAGFQIETSTLRADGNMRRFAVIVSPT